MKRLASIIGIAVGLLTILGAAWSVYENLNAAHAQKIEVMRLANRIRAEELDRDIKAKSETRDYYLRLSAERELSTAEQQRHDYLVEQLARKYAEQREIQAWQRELESK